MKPSRGFSLIELLTVVAIIGIIAAFAMPAYKDYVTRGKLVEASSGLADYRVRMEQYFQDNRKYDGTGLGTCGASAPASKYFDFSCTSTGAPAQSYTAKATGKATEGMSGFEFTITEANAKSSNITASGWANPNPNDCWARTKDGRC